MITFDRGIFRIKCVKTGGHTLTGYGAYAFAENEELDLLGSSVPATLRCLEWSIAQNMCSNPNLEIAQLITAGDFMIVESRKPAIQGGTI
jgi:hypothetical protein